MNWPLGTLVTISLAYARVFSYPLRDLDIHTWLPFRRESMAKVRSALKKSAGRKIGEFWILPGNSGDVPLRHTRERVSQAKWQKAKNVANKLMIIPTLRLVGVTGAVAVNNAEETDDIDLFMITSPGTLWSTRLLTTVFVQLMGIRRRPRQTEVKDAVCLNMFMTEDCLALPDSERDYYSSHEVLQMVPLWYRADAYRKFLRANEWVSRFFPNAWDQRLREAAGMWVRDHGLTRVFVTALRILEPVLMSLQLWYMQRRRTSEVVTGDIIRFHPSDARAWIKDRFRMELSRYHIPLDKVFYAG